MKKPRIIKRADVVQLGTNWQIATQKRHSVALLTVLAEMFPDDARRIVARIEQKSENGNASG